VGGVYSSFLCTLCNSEKQFKLVRLCQSYDRNSDSVAVWCLLQALIGQKYGYRSFPSVINSDIFETLRSVLLTDGRDVSQLDVWFKKDCNVLPPVYILQPISSILRHYKNKVSSLSALYSDITRTRYQAYQLYTQTLQEQGIKPIGSILRHYKDKVLRLSAVYSDITRTRYQAYRLYTQTLQGQGIKPIGSILRHYKDKVSSLSALYSDITRTRYQAYRLYTQTLQGQGIKPISSILRHYKDKVLRLSALYSDITRIRYQA